MQAIVLYHSPWQPTIDMAMAVGAGLMCRVVDFEHRPDLASTRLVVLVAPGGSMLDPRLLAFAALELRHKTLALASDTGIIGGALFWPIEAAALLGGAQVYAPALHASTGWLADTRGRAVREAGLWGAALALAFPGLLPRGEAGPGTPRGGAPGW